MTEKRYYSVDYDEQYYIFDSDVIRKGRVEEEAEYSYDVFANSMSSTEIIDKLNELTNESEQLKNKCENYKQALLDLGINVNILDGTGDD